MMTKDIGRILIISTLVLFTSFLIWQFSKNLLEGSEDETLALYHSSIDLSLPLNTIVILNGELLNSFSEDLKQSVSLQAIERISVFNDVSSRLEFNGNSLVYNHELRKYLDDVLLLYPSFSFEQIRYVMAKKISELDASFAINRFLMFDELFVKYVHLLKEQEALEIDDGALPDLLERFNKIKALRKTWLGEELALVFFGEQESYLQKNIFKRP